MEKHKKLMIPVFKELIDKVHYRKIMKGEYYIGKKSEEEKLSIVPFVFKGHTLGVDFKVK